MINKFCDYLFAISLISLFPVMAVYISAEVNIIYSTTVGLAFYFYKYRELKKINENKKNQIDLVVNSFLRSKDYESMKVMIYKYPMSTFFCLSNRLNKDEILSLDLTKLSHKEFRPDKKMINTLLDYFEDSSVTFDDVDSEDFMGNFLHYYADRKNN